MNLLHFFQLILGVVTLAMVPTETTAFVDLRNIDFKPNFQKLKTRLNSALDTIDISKISRSIDNQAQVISEQMTKFTSLMETMFERMNQLEKQMVKVENIVKAQENKTLAVTEYVQLPRQNCLEKPQADSDSSDYDRKSARVEENPPLKAQNEKTWERIGRIENVVFRIEQSLHDMRVESDSNWRLYCVKKKYIDQLHQETNEICRGQKNINQALSGQMARNNATANSTSPLPPLIEYHLQTLNHMVQNVSSVVNKVHFEVTEGKMAELESGVESVRVLYNELVNEIEMKNANGNPAFEQVIRAFNGPENYDHDYDHDGK